MSVCVAMAYHSGDREQVMRWMNWVKDLGGFGDHKFFTMPSFNCEPVPDILPNTRLEDEEKVVSDWQSTNPARSAAAPNSMFRQFAWHFHYAKVGSWMFCEPDCVPLVPNWLDTLEAEYVKGGKAFMGAHVLIERVPEHMSGNGIYPQDVPSLAPTLVMQTNWVVEGREYELAFDIAGSREVLPQAHFTNLIQHKFRHKGFKSKEEFDALIDPQAVVFHSNKDGSIYRYLNGGEKRATVIAGQPEIGDLGSAESTPTNTGISKNSAPSVQLAGAAFNERFPTFGEIADKQKNAATAPPAGAAPFPQEVRERALLLAALATNPYRRRKVREALKKVGLI